MHPLTGTRRLRTMKVVISSLMLLFSLGIWAKDGSIYDFPLKDIKGNPTSLAEYKGKVLLLVNVASECGYTYQYENLEKVYEKYHSQGFEIVGFPANNFGGQEPGTNKEIEKFCRLKKGAKFPMMSKISVKGKDQHPLYQYLTAKTSQIGWNFEKILVSKDGQIIQKYPSKIEPDSPEITSAIEKQLK